MNYQVYLIEEPYHYYEKSSMTRELLSEVFKNQIRGYKSYYPDGVCPVSEYDFFTNHIILINKSTNEVILSYKILKHETCRKYNKEYPILKVLTKENPQHYKEVDQWIKKHPNSGYIHSWTMDPDIPKEQRKEFVDITFMLYAKFFEHYKIMNLIDISITPFKIHKIKEWMGNKYLANLQGFPVKDYGNKDGVIMVNEGLVWSREYRQMINKYSELWESRLVINKEVYGEELKAA